MTGDLAPDVVGQRPVFLAYAAVPAEDRFIRRDICLFSRRRSCVSGTMPETLAHSSSGVGIECAFVGPGWIARGPGMARVLASLRDLRFALKDLERRVRADTMASELRADLLQVCHGRKKAIEGKPSREIAGGISGRDEVAALDCL